MSADLPPSGPADPPAPPARAADAPVFGSPGARLFLLSFTALFLELIMIRWAPSQLRLIAYYANLMLVSSFLGLGAGAMIADRGWRCFRFFPVLLAANVAFLHFAAKLALPTGAGEWRFQLSADQLSSYVALVFVFLLNAVNFVPLGEAIGAQFNRLPPLRAYLWDLSGSLGGTLMFGAFSFLWFSPAVGMLVVAVCVLLASSRTQRWLGLPFFAAVVALLVYAGRRDPAIWSPYYFITVAEKSATLTPTADGRAQVAHIVEQPAGDPPAALATMTDPPIYTVRVNQDFYQIHGALNLARYAPGGWKRAFVSDLVDQYGVPYRLVPGARRILVLGAGGGMDIEAALQHGATQIDAVEIDPAIPALSNHLNAAAPYADPRVRLHVTDARSFLQSTTSTFDLVVFGFLDSQALFSYGVSLRLDGYTYTVESFRKAYAHVADRGALVVCFYAGRQWMALKLVQMVQRATGREPLVYQNAGKILVAVPKFPLASPPLEIAHWSLTRAPPATLDLATDDWPYLYLQHRGIPRDYAVAIGVLLLVSLLALLALNRGGFGAGDLHFLFLGWGFLLLQTKSIGDCSLYFGATWFVTTLVIAGILAMVLLANWVALHHLRTSRLWLYAPLFASLVLLFAMPREFILGQPYALRLAWVLVVVPLPVFFAGLIFSTTFREARHPAGAFGANLIGATLGGFCEYLGMWLGTPALGLIVLAAYAASLASRALPLARLRPAPPPA